MKSEFQKHKKSDAIKWIAVFIAILLLSVSVSAALTKGFTDINPFGWFDNKTDQTKPETDGFVMDGDGNKLNIGKVYPMPSNLVFASASTFSNAPSEVFVDIRAVIEPEYTTYKNVEWTLSWVEQPDSGDEPVEPSNPGTAVPASIGSESSVNVNDYVVMQVSPDDSRRITLFYINSFDKQIELTARVADQPNIFETCTIDCLARKSLRNFYYFGYSDEALTPIDPSAERYFEDPVFENIKYDFRRADTEIDLDSPTSGIKFAIGVDCNLSERYTINPLHDVSVSISLSPWVVDAISARKINCDTSALIYRQLDAVEILPIKGETRKVITTRFEVSCFDRNLLFKIADPIEGTTKDEVINFLMPLMSLRNLEEFEAYDSQNGARWFEDFKIHGFYTIRVVIGDLTEMFYLSGKVSAQKITIDNSGVTF